MNLRRKEVSREAHLVIYLTSLGGTNGQRRFTRQFGPVVPKRTNLRSPIMFAIDPV